MSLKKIQYHSDKGLDSSCVTASAEAVTESAEAMTSAPGSDFLALLTNRPLAFSTSQAQTALTEVNGRPELRTVHGTLCKQHNFHCLTSVMVAHAIGVHVHVPRLTFLTYMDFT